MHLKSRANHSHAFPRSLLAALILAGSLVAASANAAGVPTYGVCFVEFRHFAASRWGGTNFVSERFTVLEDAEAKPFGPEGRYTIEDTRNRPLDKTTNVDQVRQGHEGASWTGDDIKSQFYRFAGGGSDPDLSGYGCLQFLTTAAADAFIARLGYDQTRLRGWVPAGPHVVAEKATSPFPVPLGAGKPANTRAAGSGGALVVEAAKRPVVPGWDEAARKQLQNDADARAKSIALALANDSKVKAEVAEAVRKLKARGRAQ